MTSPLWGKPQTGFLSGGRLHLQHGPIDLIIKVKGELADVMNAYEAATARFQTVLGELVGELGLLRHPLTRKPPVLHMPIAQHMLAACWPHRAQFITPMAAVAGAVADDILNVMLQTSPDLHTAYVNNGGDIACHASDAHTLHIGVVKDLTKAVPEGNMFISQPCGIATSGWRGRSFSLGIADAVTVVANNAANADAAATIIANAVNVDDPVIVRAAAQSLDPDSDLRELRVTTDVGVLSAGQIKTALLNGVSAAQTLLDQDHITAALLSLQGEWNIVQNGNAKTLS
jgi:uncharacterized protein